jgi:hypothetical protein
VHDAFQEYKPSSGIIKIKRWESERILKIFTRKLKGTNRIARFSAKVT